MKRGLLFLIAVVLFALPVKAENFDIQEYHVAMKVEKDKTATVVENIKTFFHTPSHGIFRDVPVKTRENIGVSYVSEPYEVTGSAGEYKIKIGDPDTLIEGEHDYTIVYIHSMPNKPREFYYNIIGTGWPVVIKKVFFEIELPAPVNFEQVGLSIGRYGTKGFEGDAVYQVNGSHISGYTEKALMPNEGVTIRVRVPEGYFEVPFDETPIIVACGLAFLTFVCFAVWFFIGKDDHVIPVISFYPPKDFNSAEFEVLFKGKASSKGLVSLIFYLADKGYIKIEPKGQDFILYKLKEYEGGDATTSDFMDSIFRRKDKVFLSDLEISGYFYHSCKDTIKAFNGIRTNIFYENSIGWFYRLLLGGAVIGIIGLNLFVLAGLDGSLLQEYAVLALFPLGGLVIWFLGNRMSFVKYVIWAVSCCSISVLQFFNHTSFEFFKEKEFMWLIPFGVACLFISAICLYQLPKRNQLGRRLLSEVLGFKQFLETVETPRIKALAKQDQNYGSHILPYLYLFGFSAKQMEKFLSAFVQNIAWFDGNFNFRTFSSFSGKMEKTTLPSVENGGISRRSSGGGGFSGGGSGGGGGGSW